MEDAMIWQGHTIPHWEGARYSIVVKGPNVAAHLKDAEPETVKEGIRLLLERLKEKAPGPA